MTAPPAEHVRRVFHVNVNCSNLGSSLDFYRGLGLEPTVRTAPEHPQAGAAFGLERAQWDAWILAGGDGYDAPVLDLLEWKLPPPGPRVDDAGYRALHLGGGDVAPAAALDPDGTAIVLTAGSSPSVRGVTVACSDVERSERFYAAALGLSRAGPRTLADDRGPDVFAITLERTRGPIGRPAANDLGIYRVAFLTEDLDGDCARLDGLGARPYSPPATLEMGPGLPALRAVFFPDPDGATLELIEAPAARAS
jgi:catechol 2,3-dioxygenase-like lactoylglutathione lyase family enzyme